MNQQPNDPKAGNGARRPPEERKKQNPLLAIVLAPIRAVGWFVGWDSEGGVKGVLGSFKTIIYAVVIAMVVRTFFYEPFNIPSGSMKPTLLIGDYLFVSKFSYGYSRYSLGFGLDVPLFNGRVLGGEPERGDVAVFRKPTETSIDFIKRVVGLPGDTIHINGLAVEHEPAAPFLDATCTGGRELAVEAETLPNGVSHPILGSDTSHPFDNTPIYTVPEGHYFMMGDNRDRSNDSRAFADVGFVPAENLIGRAEFLFFSTDGCGGLLEPWTWPSSIRWGRLFQPVE